MHLPFHLQFFELFIECDDLAHDVSNGVYFRIPDLIVVFLIDSQLYVDFSRPHVVLEAEDGRIDLKLIWRSRYNACLQIMNPEQVVTESDCVTCPVTVHRIEKNLFCYHSVANCIIDIHVEALSGPWHLDAKPDSFVC